MAERRVLTLHLMGPRDRHTGGRPYGTFVTYLEDDFVSLKGILAACKIHDPSAKLSIPLNSDREEGLLVQTNKWAMLCKTEHGWQRAWNRVLNETSD